MASTLRPNDRPDDDDVVSLARTEWKDWTGTEEALSKLARIGGTGQPLSGSAANSEPGAGQLAGSTIFVPAEQPTRRRRPLHIVVRYLVTFCFGVAATFAWQRHGEALAQRPIAEVWQSYGEAAK